MCCGRQQTVNRCVLIFFCLFTWFEPHSHFAYSLLRVNLQGGMFSKLLTMSSARQGTLIMGKNLNYIMPFDSNAYWPSLALTYYSVLYLQGILFGPPGNSKTCYCQLLLNSLWRCNYYFKSHTHCCI